MDKRRCAWPGPSELLGSVNESGEGMSVVVVVGAAAAAAKFKWSSWEEFFGRRNVVGGRGGYL